MTLNCGDCLMEKGEIVPFDREIPTCFLCHKTHTLILTDDNIIRCTKDAGGCGHAFEMEEFPYLYVKTCKNGHLVDRTGMAVRR